MIFGAITYINIKTDIHEMIAMLNDVGELILMHNDIDE